MVTGFPSSARYYVLQGRWDVLPRRYERLVQHTVITDANRADIKHHAIEVAKKLLPRKML